MTRRARSRESKPSMTAGGAAPAAALLRRGERAPSRHVESGVQRDGVLDGDQDGVTRYASKTASTLRRALSSIRSSFTSPTSAVYQFFAS